METDRTPKIAPAVSTLKYLKCVSVCESEKERGRERVRLVEISCGISAASPDTNRPGQQQVAFVVFVQEAHWRYCVVCVFGLVSD